jgi:hypothetical protein
MPTIGNNLLPYPNTSDEPNIPKAISDLASAVDSAIGGGEHIYQTLSDMQSVPSSQLFEGMHAVVVGDATADSNGEYTVKSGKWVPDYATALFKGPYMSSNATLVRSHGIDTFNIVDSVTQTVPVLANFKTGYMLPQGFIPSVRGTVLFIGNNSQTMEWSIASDGSLSMSSNGANTGYYFTGVGSWATR